jgi:uncharacterized protein YbaR (Trm112 family)
MQTKLVQCPHCGTGLRVDNPKNELKKIITCPNCKKKTYVKFAKEEEPLEAHTVYVTPKRKCSPVDDGETRLETSFNSAETRLVDNQMGAETILSSSNQKKVTPLLAFEGQNHNLKDGRNIIGRKGHTSKATIQIPTNDRYMSRQHCCIEVSTLSDGTKKAVISNYQNKNLTKINGQQIETGDEVRLSNGNTITMGGTTVTFLIK